MAAPLPGLARGPGVDRDFALAVLVRSAEGNPELNRPRAGKAKGRMHGELFERQTANLLAGPQRELQEGGAGQDHRPSTA